MAGISFLLSLAVPWLSPLLNRRHSTSGTKTGARAASTSSLSSTPPWAPTTVTTTTTSVYPLSTEFANFIEGHRHLVESPAVNHYAWRDGLMRRNPSIDGGGHVGGYPDDNADDTDLNKDKKFKNNNNKKLWEGNLLTSLHQHLCLDLTGQLTSLVDSVNCATVAASSSTSHPDLGWSCARALHHLESSCAAPCTTYLSGLSDKPTQDYLHVRDLASAWMRRVYVDLASGWYMPALPGGPAAGQQQQITRANIIAEGLLPERDPAMGDFAATVAAHRDLVSRAVGVFRNCTEPAATLLLLGRENGAVWREETQRRQATKVGWWRSSLLLTSRLLSTAGGGDEVQGGNAQRYKELAHEVAATASYVAHAERYLSFLDELVARTASLEQERRAMRARLVSAADKGMVERSVKWTYGDGCAMVPVSSETYLVLGDDLLDQLLDSTRKLRDGAKVSTSYGFQHI